MFAQLPEPPYHAVIFSSQRSERDPAGYEHMADTMVRLAASQPGFLGLESARDADGFGITVSYWESLAAIAAWKAQSEHQVAQELGKREWYANYQLRIASVGMAYGKVEARQN